MRFVRLKHWMTIMILTGFILWTLKICGFLLMPKLPMLFVWEKRSISDKMKDLGLVNIASQEPKTVQELF